METQRGELVTYPSLSAFAPKVLRHEVVQHLLRAIFAGLLPAGSRLIVQKLATQFGISSTPVREALVELEFFGMVEITHNRGAVVRPFGKTALAEIYQLRRVLETEAARIACERIESGRRHSAMSAILPIVAVGDRSGRD